MPSPSPASRTDGTHPAVPGERDAFARLRASADFQRVQSTGRRHRGRHLVLVAAPGAAPTSRFGLAVGRKVGSAVRRNRVKRWLREAVRPVPPPPDGPWDLVWIALPGAADAGFHVLSAEARDLMSRVRR